MHVMEATGQCPQCETSPQTVLTKSWKAGRPPPGRSAMVKRNSRKRARVGDVTLSAA